MRRSLFLTFFLRVFLLLIVGAIAPVAIVAGYSGSRSFDGGLLVAVLAGAALLAGVAALGIRRSVQKALSPLQSLAETVPDKALALDDFELQRYRDFDGLAGAIAG